MTTKLIGITDLELHIPTKQDVLLFDEIGITGLDKTLAGIKDKNLISDIEYLANQGIIFNAQYEATPETKNSNLERQLTEIVTANIFLSTILERNDENDWRFVTDSKIVQKTLEKVRTAPGINTEEVADFVARQFREFQILKSVSPSLSFNNAAKMLDLSAKVSKVRLFSIHYNKYPQVNAVPLIQVPKLGIFGDTEEKDVAELVIKKMPTLDEDTPLEAILDFRQDPETRRRLTDLRYWMNNVRKEVNEGKVSYNELEERLDYLLHEYIEYMKLQKMKINATTLETTFTVVAGFVENLIKLKFETAVKSLFLLRHRKIALLEAELAAPGRQVAFVATATETFDRG